MKEINNERIICKRKCSFNYACKTQYNLRSIVSQLAIRMGISMKMQRLRNLREDNDLTQSQMGKLLSITQKAYSNYETGKRSVPLDSLVTLAQYFRTSTDYLLEVTDVRKPYAYRNLIKYDQKLKSKRKSKSISKSEED